MNAILNSLVVVCAVWLAGCAASQVPTVPVNAPLRHDVAVLSSEAMEGRGPGTAGLELALNYLEAQLAELDVEITLGVEATTAELAETTTNAAARAEQDFTVLGFSADASFAGDAVWVGYAIHAPELDYSSFGAPGEQDLKGKVAVALRYEPMDDDGRSLLRQRQRERGMDQANRARRFTRHANLTAKAQAVAGRGAVGLIIVNPPTMDARGLKSTATSQARQRADIPVFHARRLWLQQLLDTTDRDGGGWVDIMTDRANRGVDQPEAMRLSFTGESKIETQQTTVDNVAAVLPGSGKLKDQWVVVGAHYDHLGFGGPGSFVRERALHPGADDNASGTAVVVSVARRMAADALASPDVERRSVLFALFTAEERGLLGASHMVEQVDDLPLEWPQVTAMVNLDMVGRLDERLTIMGSGSSQGWATHTDAAGEAAGVKLTVNAGATGNSDHAVFHRVGVPAVHLFTGVHDDYHRPSDTLDTLNLPGLERVALFTVELVRSLAVAAEPLAFDDSFMRTPQRSAPGSGSGAYLGIMPDYNTMDGDRGAGVTSVTAESPAEKGGLRAGDLIITWDGETVGNVRGLTELLADAQPGQAVSLIVQRDQQKMELTVTLGER